MWDCLLENRIRLQKMLVEVNKLPQHDAFDDIKERGGGQIKDPLNNSKLVCCLNILMVSGSRNVSGSYHTNVISKDCFTYTTQKSL